MLNDVFQFDRRPIRLIDEQLTHVNSQTRPRQKDFPRRPNRFEPVTFERSSAKRIVSNRRIKCTRRGKGKRPAEGGEGRARGETIVSRATVPQGWPVRNDRITSAAVRRARSVPRRVCNDYSINRPVRQVVFVPDVYFRFIGLDLSPIDTPFPSFSNPAPLIFTLPFLSFHGLNGVASDSPHAEILLRAFEPETPGLVETSRNLKMFRVSRIRSCTRVFVIRNSRDPEKKRCRIDE